MKRAMALYNLAKVIVDQCIDERGDRIDERIRELDVVKKQQYAQEGLTDADD